RLPGRMPNRVSPNHTPPNGAGYSRGTYVSRFITTPTKSWLAAGIKHCSERFLFASPYVGAFLGAVTELLPTTVSKTLLTRTDLRDFALGSSDIEALCEFSRRGSQVLSLAGLHAKVYVLDNSAALVTSANATHSGMTRNWECQRFRLVHAAARDN